MRNTIIRLQEMIVPMLICIVLLPLSRELSPMANIQGNAIFLLYLPLALAISVVMLFGMKGFAPLFIVYTFYYSTLNIMSLTEAVVLSLCYGLPLWGSFCVMDRMVGVRWRCDIDSMTSRALGIRMFVFGLLYPLACKGMMLAFGSVLDMSPVMERYFSYKLDMFAVVNVEALVLSSIAISPAYYYTLRMLLNRNYAKKFFNQCLRDAFSREKHCVTFIWLGILLGALFAICFPAQENFNVSYFIPLLFILFTYGIFRFGHRVILLMWSFTSLCLFIFNSNFSVELNSSYQIAFLSASLIAFTVSIFYMAVMFKRSEVMKRVYMHLARIDPMVGLANIRSLSEYIENHPKGKLCFLRLTNLEALSRYHGMMMRVDTKRRIAAVIKPLLKPGEDIYQLPGCELLLYLDTTDNVNRIHLIRQCLCGAELSWNDNPVMLRYGIAYTQFDATKESLYTRVGKLHHLSERASLENEVISLEENAESIREEVSERVVWLRKITTALLENRLELYAQPIVHSGGKSYYEILARLLDNGEVIPPSKFIPLISEFNLCAQFDLLMVENVVKHISEAKLDTSNTCFSVNLMPLTLMQRDTAPRIIKIFEHYQVRPEAIIFEITEEQHLVNENIEHSTIKALRDYHFKIAIDDFGTGFSNYQRLKSLNADVVKIDGVFVKDIVNNSLDQLIIKSICDIAREKKLQVVAEYVESQEQLEMLQQLGVQYLQGFLLGEPKPLSSF
ncbi:MAG: EAL domain-containing protein [Hafnia alvei]|uniref:sensor domain-containing phosphodiesterase n=1 Tax=Hafnia alvei TaxID=569 RepID=UPI003F918B17